MSVLTKQQEEYVQARFEGLTQRQSYYRAYPHAKKWKDSTVDVKACELEKDTKILVRLQGLRDVQAKKSVHTVETLVDEAEEIRKLCTDKNYFDLKYKGTIRFKLDSKSALNAINTKARLLGLDVQKVENNNTTKITIEGDIEEWAR